MVRGEEDGECILGRGGLGGARCCGVEGWEEVWGGEGDVHRDLTKEVSGCLVRAGGGV